MFHCEPCGAIGALELGWGVCVPEFYMVGHELSSSLKLIFGFNKNTKINPIVKIKMIVKKSNIPYKFPRLPVK